MGLYTDPYDMFGRLSMEMMRACRLVVDTGMHKLGWTRQQAIDYMVLHTASDAHEITAEIDRYVCMYVCSCSLTVHSCNFHNTKSEKSNSSNEKSYRKLL